jgi:hypothetical protein
MAPADEDALAEAELADELALLEAELADLLALLAAELSDLLMLLEAELADELMLLAAELADEEADEEALEAEDDDELPPVMLLRTEPWVVLVLGRIGRLGERKSY